MLIKNKIISKELIFIQKLFSLDKGTRSNRHSAYRNIAS